MQTKLTLKTVIPYIVIGILIVILSFIMKDCNHKPNLTVISNDSINSEIADKEKILDSLKNRSEYLNAKIDSLKHLKPKVIVRYKTVYDSLLIIDTMCVQALNTLHDEHSKIDSVNNGIIDMQENHIMNDSHIIGELVDIVALKQNRISSDSLTIKEQNKQIKKGKLKTIFGTAIGVVAGIGLGSIIR